MNKRHRQKSKVSSKFTKDQLEAISIIRDANHQLMKEPPQDSPINCTTYIEKLTTEIMNNLNKNYDKEEERDTPYMNHDTDLVADYEEKIKYAISSLKAIIKEASAWPKSVPTQHIQSIAEHTLMYIDKDYCIYDKGGNDDE